MVSDTSSTDNNNNNNDIRGTHTPTNTAAAMNQTRIHAAPDLSPPASQDTMAVDFGPGSQDAKATAQGQGNVLGESDDAAGSQRATGPTSGSSNGEYANAREYAAAEPGSAWRNKRAQEEYQRALESVVDRDFTLGWLISSLSTTGHCDEKAAANDGA